jgi:type I restriction enzyme M protein
MTDKELKKLKDGLWHSADMLRAGAHLAANKYGQPILGLIFLRYADIKYKQHKDEIMAMLRDRKTYKDIADRYGVSMSTAAAYCKKSKMISHLSMVHTSLENRKNITEAMENIWFGAKR